MKRSALLLSRQGSHHPYHARSPMIRVDDFSKSYGDVQAVSGLSFEADPGDVLGLVGPNGAGKTTTLRALCGIIRPTAGRISIAGHDLADEPIQAKAALAFMPDDPQHFDHLTVEEHLRFVGRIYGVADPAPRMEALLDELDLHEHRGKLPSELSRGMKQKLAIACGLLHEPSVLLFDEPLTGLDPAAIRRMKATIRSRAEAGTTIMLSSHLLHLVEELCTSILVLQNGKNVASGSIAEIVSHRPELEGQGLEDVFLALTGD